MPKRPIRQRHNAQLANFDVATLVLRLAPGIHGRFIRVHRKTEGEILTIAMNGSK
jgi:hypothetical protein